MLGLSISMDYGIYMRIKWNINVTKMLVKTLDFICMNNLQGKRLSLEH